MNDFVINYSVMYESGKATLLYQYFQQISHHKFDLHYTFE